MNSDESANASLDTLFLRAAKHPEVRMEFCAALLEAELFTLVPRGQSTRAADSVARPEGRNIPLIGWKVTVSAIHRARRVRLDVAG